MIAGICSEILLLRSGSIRVGHDFFELGGHSLLATQQGDALPLSFAQERLWFLDQLDPGGSAYHVPSAVRLTGGIEVPVWMASLREIVRRHEVGRHPRVREAVVLARFPLGVARANDAVGGASHQRFRQSASAVGRSAFCPCLPGHRTRAR